MTSIRAALLIAAALYPARTPAQDPPRGSVEGTVVNSFTGAGVAGASVTLRGSQSGRFTATSDAAGRFRMAGVAPGTYAAMAEKDGFSATMSAMRELASRGIRVDATGEPARIELKLTPLQTVIGRVLTPDGKPAAGADVELNPNIYGGVTTDAEGRFRFESVRPDSYTLMARPPKDAKPEEAADGTRFAMVATWYPSVTDAAVAQPIAFRGDGDTGNYEIRLRSAAVHRVRGILLDEAGKPAARAEVSLHAIVQGPTPPGLMSMRSGTTSISRLILGMPARSRTASDAVVTTGADGAFELPAVAPGDWRIRAVDRNAAAAADISVGSNDVEGVELRAAAGIRLTGTVEWVDGDLGAQRTEGPASFGRIILMQTGTDGIPRTGVMNSGKVAFADTPPGQYQILAGSGLQARTFVGSNEVNGTFTVTAGMPPLRIVLSTWTGGLRGTVEKGAGATVLLIPQAADGVAMGQTAECDSLGSFALSDVSPGDYYIAAFEPADWMTPSAAMVNLVRTAGKAVRIEEKSTANITLPMLSAPGPSVR